MAWALMDSLRELRLHRISKFAASLLGFDAEMAGKTWHGTDVKSTQVGEHGSKEWRCGSGIS